MTIININNDFSMQEVQQKIYYLFTRKKNKYPLLIQIPYSIGLGAGMLLFFNHWFKKKFTKEPSPLEIELHNYQKNIEDRKSTRLNSSHVAISYAVFCLKKKKKIKKKNKITN